MSDDQNKFGVAQAESFLIAKGFKGPFSISTLHGGYWNQVMKASGPDGALVLKRYAKVLPNSLFPNLPAAEAAALTRLEGLNVAPEPRGFWLQDNILLYSFVEGSLWSGDLDAVAAMLIRKERADPACFRTVPWQPEGILEQGDGLLARCSDHGHAERLRHARPRQFEIASPARLSLIHTDIGPGNLVGSGSGLRLIDWQCPAEGDVTEDIYSFLSPAFQILSDRPPLADDQIGRAHV